MKVSVVVPAFNAEKHLGECLDSILDQYLQELEIIVVDDGSTDNTAEIIKRYEKTDDRVRYIYQENKRIGGARNTGWEAARGDYIYFIDADDFIHPDWLRLLFENAIKNDLEIIVGEYIEFYNDSKTYYDIKENEFDYSSNNLRIYEPEVFASNHNNYIGPLNYEVMVWRYLYKKNFLDNLGFKFYENIWFEDAEFSHKVIFSANKIGYLNAKLLYHRKWEGAFTQKDIDKEILLSAMLVVNSLNKFYNEDLNSDYKSFFSDMISAELIRPIQYRKYYKRLKTHDEIDKRIKELSIHFKYSTKTKYKFLYYMVRLNLPISSLLLYWKHYYNNKKVI